MNRPLVAANELKLAFAANTCGSWSQSMGQGEWRLRYRNLASALTLTAYL
jgi:hypothetical protein